MMRKSTENALRWFLAKKLGEERFALEARMAARARKGVHEEELVEFEKVKALLTALEEVIA